MKIVLQHVFFTSLYRDSQSLIVELLPNNYTQHLSLKLPVLRTVSVNVLCPDLFCANVRKICPKVTASLLDTISAYERCHRSALLPDSKGNLQFDLWDRALVMELVPLEEQTAELACSLTLSSLHSPSPPVSFCPLSLSATFCQVRTAASCKPVR